LPIIIMLTIIVVTIRFRPSFSMMCYRPRYREENQQCERILIDCVPFSTGGLSWGSAALAEGQEIPPQLRCSWRSDLCRNPRGDEDLTRFIESVKSFSFTGSRISKKAHLPKTMCFHRQNGPPSAKTSLLLVCQRGGGRGWGPSPIPPPTPLSRALLWANGFRLARIPHNAQHKCSKTTFWRGVSANRVFVAFT
jgi:hypothetical protein